MADDYYSRIAAAKAKAVSDDAETYGQTTATTPETSSRYPTQRYSVMGGVVSANPEDFQSNSALIQDLGGKGKQAKGYYEGDTLPDGSNIQGITKARDGSVEVSVILPDGREAVISSSGRKVTPGTDRRAALKSMVSLGPWAPAGMEVPGSSSVSAKKYADSLRKYAASQGMFDSFGDEDGK